MKRLLPTLALLACCTAAVPAAADEGRWYVAPSILHIDDDGDRLIDDSVAGVQLVAGREMTEHLMLEGMLGYADVAGYPGQRHLELGVNGIAQAMPDAWFSPYLLAGVGYLAVDAVGGASDDRPAASFGLGFRARFGAGRVSLRGEYRARLAYDGGSHLTDRISTLGLEFGFGNAPAPLGDADGDGVHDAADRCPATVAGVVVDATGCEADDDRDGVRNSADHCPQTPSGARVDDRGCPFDSDGDGVPDERDRCPDTGAGVPVGPSGCEPDGDGDGIVDRRDACPDTAEGEPVDVRGCEIKNLIELPRVAFATNSDILLPGSEATLADAAATLIRNPALVIEVAGHTDSAGAAEHNLGLSERRALTVRDFLIRAGIDPSRLSARGFGESDPVAPNDTDEGRARNRRVELRIVGR